MFGAKVVFMKAASAKLFLEHLKTDRGIRDFGVRVYGRHNRYGHLEHEDQGISRVLKVQGRAPYMDEGFWKRCLVGMVELYPLRFHYRLSHPRQSILADGRIEVEMGFASVEGRAVFVVRDPTFQGLLDIVWAEDPCGR